MYLTREQARQVDRKAIDVFGVPGIVLMENAARGCVDVLQRLGIRGKVSICCGSGNNGGDGFAMARRLDVLGIPVEVLCWGNPDKMPSDALQNYRILQRIGVSMIAVDEKAEAIESRLAESDWIVDALLGTGFSGSPREPIASAIKLLNRLPTKRFAVDLPSGLDCDSGQPGEPTFLAEHTCTFVAHKQGFANPAAQPYLGMVHLVDIGLSQIALTA